MPPKSNKRKAPGASTDSNGPKNKKIKTNGKTAPTPPDPETWPGWVEMESEPAFFNTMLKEMNVDGVKIQEIYSLDDDSLAILPQPVHALIFLFRYRETSENDRGTHCPKHIWYAEQIPKFACATVALMNIVNNIPGLTMGTDLREFKTSTQDMSPVLRGEALDKFAFVRRIHNSFATEEELINADNLLKEEAVRERRRQAAAKAQATKAAKAAAKAAKREESAPPDPEPTGGRSSARSTRSARKTGTELLALDGTTSPSPSEVADTATTTEEEAGTETKPLNGTNSPSPPKAADTTTTTAEKVESNTEPLNGITTPLPPKVDDTTTKTDEKAQYDSQPLDGTSSPPSPKVDETITETNEKPTTTTEPLNGTSSPPAPKAADTTTKTEEKAALEPAPLDGTNSPPPPKLAGSTTKLKLKPPKRRHTEDDDFTGPAAPESGTIRRSQREPKRRKMSLPAEKENEEEEEDDDGFHFCAYMAIDDRVWNLDGLDGFPQDMGAIPDGKDWLAVTKPALERRMADYAAGAIEFNLMAVVHDTIVACVDSLAANVKALNAVEEKLISLVEGWKEIDEVDGSGTVLGESAALGLKRADIERVELAAEDEKALGEAVELPELHQLREKLRKKQKALREACEDEMFGVNSDADKAKKRRDS